MVLEELPTRQRSAIVIGLGADRRRPVRQLGQQDQPIKQQHHRYSQRSTISTRPKRTRSPSLTRASTPGSSLRPVHKRAIGRGRVFAEEHVPVALDDTSVPPAERPVRINRAQVDVGHDPARALGTAHQMLRLPRQNEPRAGGRMNEDRLTGRYALESSRRSRRRGHLHGACGGERRPLFCLELLDVLAGIGSAASARQYPGSQRRVARMSRRRFSGPAPL